MSCRAVPRLLCGPLCPGKHSRCAIRLRDNVAPHCFQCRSSSLLPISARLRPTSATRPQHGIHGSVLPHTWALCQTLGAHSEPLNIPAKLLRTVHTHPQPVRNPLNKAGNSYSSFHIHVALGGRAFGPPLCRGCAPATPPYKTIAHRPCLRIPTVQLQQRGCHKPDTQADCPSVGGNEELISAAPICGQPNMPLPKLAEIHFNQIRRVTLVVALPSQNRL